MVGAGGYPRHADRRPNNQADRRQLDGSAARLRRIEPSANLQ